MRLNDYPIFQPVDSKLREKVRMAFVYEGTDNEYAIFVTRDDDIYAFGARIEAGVEVGNPQQLKLDALGKKKVKTFVRGMGALVYIIINDGQVYAWSGPGESTEPKRLPVLVTDPNEIIVDVSCSSYACFAVTNDGKVYRGTPGDQISSFVPQEQPIEAVVCGNQHAIAVTITGGLFSQGSNDRGQLGRGKEQPDCDRFIRVFDLNSISIVKVVCGRHHTLALARNGTVYAWGDNERGQLGLGHDVEAYRPTKVPESVMGKVSDIAASNEHDISIALARSGIVFVWGRTVGGDLLAPIRTDFLDIDKAYHFHNCEKKMLTPLTVKFEPLDRMQRSFDDPDSCDLIIRVDNKPIHVHETILKIGSPTFFGTLLQDRWMDGDEKVIELDAFPYDVYRAYLKYVYTNEIDVSPDNVIGLIDLAHFCCESSELTYRLSKLIKAIMTVENVNDFYHRSNLYQDQKLKGICNEFVSKNFTNEAMLDGSLIEDESG